MAYDLNDYEEVKARIPLFYKTFENGRITTEIFSEDKDHVTIKAYLYENKEQQEKGTPLATGHALEKPGGMIKAYTENCETSAVGRALANFNMYGSVARDSGQRPSLEEMTTNVMTGKSPKTPSKPRSEAKAPLKEQVEQEIETPSDVSNEEPVENSDVWPDVDSADMEWCPLHDEAWDQDDKYKGKGHYITNERGHKVDAHGDPVKGSYNKDGITLLNTKGYPRWCYQANEGHLLGVENAEISITELWKVWSNLGITEEFVKDNVLLCDSIDEAMEVNNVTTPGGIVRVVINILSEDTKLQWGA